MWACKFVLNAEWNLCKLNRQSLNEHFMQKLFNKNNAIQIDFKPCFNKAECNKIETFAN